MTMTMFLRVLRVWVVYSRGSGVRRPPVWRFIYLGGVRGFAPHMFSLTLLWQRRLICADVNLAWRFLNQVGHPLSCLSRFLSPTTAYALIVQNSIHIQLIIYLEKEQFNQWIQLGDDSHLAKIPSTLKSKQNSMIFIEFLEQNNLLAWLSRNNWIHYFCKML